MTVLNYFRRTRFLQRYCASDSDYSDTFLRSVVCLSVVCHIYAFCLNRSSRLAVCLYRGCRSTETAVLKVVAELFTAADRGKVTLLSLLDLSAAFDTLDHDILIDRLYRAFGFRDDVLSWITSFVTGRTQRLRVGQYSTYSAV